MIQRMARPAVPCPLEDYAYQFDNLCGSMAQPKDFRRHRISTMIWT